MEKYLALALFFVAFILGAGCSAGKTNAPADGDLTEEKDETAIVDEAAKEEETTPDADETMGDEIFTDEAGDTETDLPDEDTAVPFGAVILADPPTVVESGVVTFSAQVTGGTPPFLFAWSFDGVAPDSAEEEPAPVAFPAPGDYAVALTVTDATNATAIAGTIFTVNPLEGNMHFYFGNLHSHSGASDGEGTPAEIMNWAKFDEGLDFYLMTDHAEQLSGGEWADIQFQTDLFNEPGVFAAMRGFEWSHPWNGHMCIYLTDDFTSAYNDIWISYIYDWIDERPAALAQFNHPGREDGVFNDLKIESKVIDNMFAMETGNKSTGNNDGEFIPYYIKALDNGWQLAPTSNQDNHSMKLTSHRSVFVAEELSREMLIEAMYARRFYSSDDPDIRVVFKHEEAWMGSHVTVTNDSVRFSVKVMDNEPVLKLQLITNKGAIAAEMTPEEGATTVLWYPEVTVPQSAYFFVKVISEEVFDDDGPEQIALSAPIWIYR